MKTGGRSSWAAAALAFGLLALYVAEAFLARGVYNDDDLGHYFFAKDAIATPSLFLSVWGRPLFTLVYALPAQLGFEAVRITTAVLTAAAAFATGGAAARLGVPAPLGAALLGTMPFVLLLSYSSLTEPVCALAVAAALWAWLAGRRGLGLGLAALVPLGRLELVALAGAWGLAQAVRPGPRGRRWLGLLPAAGGVGWAVCGAAVSGDPLWLAHQVFTGEENLYGHTGLWHYPRGLVYVVGPVVFLFALADLVERVARRRVDLVAVGPLAVLLLYVVFSWKLSVGHAAGFLRHLVAASPVFALAAGRGLVTALGEGAARRRALVTLAAGVVVVGLFLSRALVMHHRAEGPFELARLAAAAVVLAVVAAAGGQGRPGRARVAAAGGQGRPGRARVAAAALAGIALAYAVGAEPPLRASGEQEAMVTLHEWLVGSEWEAAPVIVTHPWFVMELDAAGRRPRGGPPQVRRSAVEQAVPGTVVIWDSHYSIRPPEGMQLREFKLDPRFTMLREVISADRRFSAYALLKTR